MEAVMKKRDYITGILFTILFISFLVYSNSLDTRAAYWPRFISIIGIALSFLLSITSYISSKKEENKNFLVFSKSQLIRISVLFLVLIAWIVGIKTLGFLTSSLIVVVFVNVFYEPFKNKKNIIRDIVTALLFVLGMYMLFKVLGIRFPKGFLI